MNQFPNPFYNFKQQSAFGRFFFYAIIKCRLVASTDFVVEGGEKVFLFVLEHVLLPLLVGLVLVLFSHWLDKH